MNFEHLLQINDPENPLVDTLSRDQLWQGLLHRVENPSPFLPGLESSTILERLRNNRGSYSYLSEDRLHH